ncbi:MAG: hypothetical protein FJ104_11575 [Deltaproteobacteria bacterium]|nr:hypothetical protein [Deltaproteobacteria bacterium]
MDRFPGRPSFALSLLVVAGCSAETKHCHEVMTTAQAEVAKVDSKSEESVRASLTAVEGAIAACQAASRGQEVQQLTQAKNQLSGHLTYLEKRAARPAEKARTPEELARVLRDGDPACPRGQAYRPKGADREVRCTGPQPVDMTRDRAARYLEERGFTVRRTDDPPELRAEHGAELLVFRHASSAPDAAPRCVLLYPPPGMSWQEAAARVTGVPPQKLDKATTVRAERGQIPMKVEDTEKKVRVDLGDCG